MNERDTKRLEKIHEKLEHMKAQRQDILAREKKRQRKERTRRLIQIGALSENYFGVKDIHPVEFEKFLLAFFAGQGIKEYVEIIKQKVFPKNDSGESTETKCHSKNLFHTR